MAVQMGRRDRVEDLAPETFYAELIARTPPAVAAAIGDRKPDWALDAADPKRVHRVQLTFLLSAMGCGLLGTLTILSVRDLIEGARLFDAVSTIALVASFLGALALGSYVVSTYRAAKNGFTWIVGLPTSILMFVKGAPVEVHYMDVASVTVRGHPRAPRRDVHIAVRLGPKKERATIKLQMLPHADYLAAIIESRRKEFV